MPTLPWVSRQLPVAPQDPGGGSMARTSAPCRARPVRVWGGPGELSVCWEGSQDLSDGFVCSSCTRTSPGPAGRPATAQERLLGGGERRPAPWGCEDPPTSGIHTESGATDRHSLLPCGESGCPFFGGTGSPPAPQSAGSGAHGYYLVSMGPLRVCVPQEHPPGGATPSPGTTQPPHPFGWRHSSLLGGR